MFLLMGKTTTTTALLNDIEATAFTMYSSGNDRQIAKCSADLARLEKAARKAGASLRDRGRARLAGRRQAESFLNEQGDASDIDW